MKQTLSLLVAMLFTASTSLTAMAKAAFDVSLVGQHGSAELAAFAFVFPILFLLISCGSGIYIATSAVFAEPEYVEEGRVLIIPLLKALLVSAFLGTCVAGLLTPILPIALAMMGAESYLTRLDSYFSIWLWTVPLMFMSANTFAVIRNMGFLKTASAITFVATVVGVALSFVLIPSRNAGHIWGIEGAAYSTLATSVLSTLISVMFALWCGKWAQGSVAEFGIVKVATKLLSIGVPVLLANVLLFFYLSAVTRVIATFGEDAIAAHGINGRVEQVLLIFQSAFCTVAIPVLAAYASGGSVTALLRFASGIAKMMLCTAAVFAVALIAMHSQIAASAPTAASQAIIAFYLLAIPVTIGFQGLFILSTTILNLMKQAKRSTFWAGANYVGVGVPAVFLLGQTEDVRAVIGGLGVCSVVVGLLAWQSVKRRIRRLRHEEQAAPEARVAMENVAA